VNYAECRSQGEPVTNFPDFPGLGDPRGGVSVCILSKLKFLLVSASLRRFPKRFPPPLPLLPYPPMLAAQRRIFERLATPHTTTQHPSHDHHPYAYTRRCGSNAPAACGPPPGSSGSGAPSRRHTSAASSYAGACKL
jgi:hypothetical protein